MSNIDLIQKKISNLNSDKKPIIIISGPTGIGKSNFAVLIAQKLNGYIINADSMQIYKELKIISCQPSEEQKKNICHFLYGIKSINEKFSVMEWLKAVQKILQLKSNGNKIPIIVGGTGLYIKSAINGISEIPAVDKFVYQASMDLFNKIGINEFRKLILEIDSQFVSKNIDKQRLIRAHSIFVQTGKNLTEWFKSSKKIKISENFFCILLQQERKIIYKNCENRFDKFIDEGVLKEVKLLKNNKFNTSSPGFKCLGVNWLLKYLEEKISFKDAILLSKRDTRRYVKRQLTWLRHNYKPNLIISV